MDTDRNLLFGVLTRQAELIDDSQFAEACTPWATRKRVALPDLFVSRGWITRQRRTELERLLEGKVQRHGGDVRATLAAVASDDGTCSLEGLGDPEIQRSLGMAIPPSPAELSTEFASPTRSESTQAILDSLNVPGTTGPRYTLTRLHKKGGLSEVWVARDRDLNREVALKKLQPRQAASPEAARRFLKEAQITGQLEHPNIVPIYELASPLGDQQAFYTMRLVRGQNLRQAIADYHQRRQKGNADPLDLPRLLRAFVSVCNAIGYSHSRGVVHRDLKPENIVVGEFGEVMVLDWGLAKLMDEPTAGAEVTTDLPTVTEKAAAEATTAGSILGTPAYMAPEQAEGCQDLVDYRSDVYGLGATLFTILAGRPPHQMELGNQIVVGKTPRARTVDPSVSPALDAICAKAMARDRAARYTNPSELADDIERYLADEPVLAYPDRWLQRLARWARHHRTGTQAAALALIAVTLSSVVATFLVNKARSNESQAKQIATERFKQARDAVDTLLTGVSDGLKDVPGAQKVRNELLQKAMEAYEQFTNDKGGNADLQADSARAFVQLADIRRTLGDVKGAEVACRSAESLFDKLSQEHPANPDYRLGLANSRDQLGLALDMMGRHKEAESAYVAAIAVADELVITYPDVLLFPAYREQLVHSRTGLGIVLAELGRLQESEQAYRAAITDAVILVQAHPTVSSFRNNPTVSSFRNNLARSRANLANLLQSLDRPTDAELEYRAAIASLESLLEPDSEVPDYRNRLASTRSNLGALLKDGGRVQDAELNYRAAIEGYDALVNYNPAVPEYRAGLVAAYQNLGHLLSAQNNREEAETAYRTGCEEGARIVAEQPSAPADVALVGDTWRHFGVFLRESGSARLADSLRVLEEAVRIHQTLVDRDPDFVQYRQNLESSLHQRAMTLSELRSPDQAVGGVGLSALAGSTRDKAQAIRPVRSAAQRLVSDIEIGAEEFTEAAKVYADCQRVAVLPFIPADTAAEMQVEGVGFMEAMLADLRYVPDYLVLDDSEVLVHLAANGFDTKSMDLRASAEIGRQLGARYVVTGSFAIVDDDIRLTAQLLDCSAAEVSILAKAESAGHKRQIFELGDIVIQSLLEQMGSLPEPAKVREMSKIPTVSFRARRECDAGFALLSQAAGLAKGEAQQLSEKGLKHAETAMQDDPSYVQAYILKTSCLWNLDRKADMEACLRAVRIQSDPSLVDELTRLELDGDYATFVERNFDSAIDSYKKILEIDRGHIRALWSLAALYSGDYGAADAGFDDRDVAATYAARLILAHPKSAMAAFLANKNRK